MALLATDMPLTSRQREKAAGDPMGANARMHTYCTPAGAFMDEVLDADFVSARARMATMKSAMLIEAPSLVNNKRRHPTGCSYHQAYNKALSKHHEMEAREGKFAANLVIYSAEVAKGGNPATVLDDYPLGELRMDMIWLLIVREAYDGFDWKTDEPRR